MFQIYAENSVDNMKMLTIVEQFLHRAKALSSSHPTSPGRKLGVHKLGGRQLGQLTPTDQRNIAYYVTSCSAYRAGGRTRKEGMF